MTKMIDLALYYVSFVLMGLGFFLGWQLVLLGVLCLAVWFCLPAVGVMMGREDD